MMSVMYLVIPFESFESFPMDLPHNDWNTIVNSTPDDSYTNIWVQNSSLDANSGSNSVHFPEMDVRE